MSLTQLIASSPADAFIYGEPNMSPFRARFASSTPFSTEMVLMDFSSYSVPGRGTIVIPRRADMLMGVFIAAQMQLANFANTFFPIENLVKHVELYIGGQLIETFDNTWLRTRNTILTDNSEKDSIYAMENFEATDPPGMVRTLWLKLPFWFNNVAKALPLIALQYHEVRLDFIFNDPASIPGIDPTFKPILQAWGEYAYLGPKERKWFASTPHVYMIEQTQVRDFPSAISQTQSTSINYTIPFNLPVRYLFWVFRNNDQFGIYTADGNGLSANQNAAPLQSAKIQINGVDRFHEQIGSYFRLIETNRTMRTVPPAGFYSYFFSKNPIDEGTIMGTLNFSAIDTVKLMVTTKAASQPTLATVLNENTTLAAATNLNIFTVIGKNINILRIESGMGGIMFAN